MINKRTVFVIGAGASAECNMPAGSGLKQKIANGMRFRERGFIRSGDINLLALINKKAAGDTKQRDVLTRAANDLAATMQTFPSVDEALHWWKGSGDIVEIGKAAIAHYILSAERESCLKPNSETGLCNLGQADRTWLPHFMSIALSGLTREPKAKSV